MTFSPRRSIRSIQRGSIDSGAGGTNTATITSVDITSSFVRIISSFAIGSPNPIARFGRLRLTNATTVTMVSFGDNVSDTCRVYFEVIEFWPGLIKSVQQIVATMGPGSTVLGTGISAVVLANASLYYQGINVDSVTSGANLEDEQLNIMEFTSTTNVQFTRSAATNNGVTFGAVVVEHQ